MDLEEASNADDNWINESSNEEVYFVTQTKEDASLNDNKIASTSPSVHVIKDSNSSSDDVRETKTSSPLVEVIEDSNSSFDTVNITTTISSSVDVFQKLQTPFVCTTRLDDMPSMLLNFEQISNKEIFERIERGSRPLCETPNQIFQPKDMRLILYNQMLYKLNSCKNKENICKESSTEKVKEKTISKEVGAYKNPQKQNTIDCNVKSEYVMVSSSEDGDDDDDDDDDDEDSMNLNELYRIICKNRVLLGQCKPVKVVLEDIGEILKNKQIVKPKHLKQNTDHAKKVNKQNAALEQSNRSYDHNRFIRIAPKESQKKISSELVAIPLLLVSPLLESRNRKQLKAQLTPPLGFTWNPAGAYIVFHDLLTKETEAHFIDPHGRPKEYYKFDFESTTEMEKFITSRKYMKLNCCCWHRREAYILCMSPQYVPKHTALLFKKPHKCLFYNCTCCCKGLISELDKRPRLNQDLSVIETQVSSLHPDEKEDTLKGKPNIFEELLTKSTNSWSMINRALTFNTRKPLKKSSDNLNRFQKFTKVCINNTIDGRNEIYVKDSNEGLTLHAIDVGNSISDPSVLIGDEVIESICCWYKLQSMCESLHLPLSFSTCKHSCPPKDCCCCCKPKSEVIKSSFAFVHPPIRDRHSMLENPEIERREMSTSDNFTGTNSETTNKIQQLKSFPTTSNADVTTNNTILAQILNQKSRLEMFGTKEDKISARLKNTPTVKEYIDKVIENSLSGGNNKHRKPTKEVKSKRPLRRAIPKPQHDSSPAETSKVSTDVEPPISTELSNQHHTTDISEEMRCKEVETSTPIITGVYGNSSNRTDFLNTYPIITNVFSVSQAATYSTESSHPNATLAPGLCASASNDRFQAPTLESNEKIVESVISTVLETFKNVHLTINDDGKVAAALKTPVYKLSTAELKILGNILSHAQSQVETLGLKPGTNINNLMQELPFAAPYIATNISSTIHESINTAQVIPGPYSQCTETNSNVPGTPLQTICKKISAEMDKKMKNYVTSYQTLKKLSNNAKKVTKQKRPSKRQMQDEQPVQPKIRVISPSRLGALSSFSHDMEHEKTDRLGYELAIASEDIENQLHYCTIPVQGTDNASLQFPPIPLPTEFALINEPYQIEIEIGEEV